MEHVIGTIGHERTTSVMVSDYKEHGFMIHFLPRASNVNCAVILDDIEDMRGLIEILNNAIKTKEASDGK